MKFITIVIGDELLLGQVTDTNSGFIARQIAPYGWQSAETITVGDNADDIRNAVDHALGKAELVLLTGGLGPTKDDITKTTLCRYFGTELVFDPDTAANVESIVAGRHLKLNDYTRAQAMVPAGCKVIQNLCGTAPILWFERDGKVLVSMPGVPYETETMFPAGVLPLLVSHFHRDTNIRLAHMMVTGIIESALAMKLDDFEKELPGHIHLAYLPQPGLIKLRLTGIHSDAARLDKEISQATDTLHQILGRHIVADEDLSLSGIVGKILGEKKLTLSTAESCTGGNIAHEITRVAGSSDYFIGSVVSYHSDVKVHMLGVSQEVIERETVVSRPVAEQMACGVADRLHTDCAIATTGIAGPGGGTPENPVGTVWIAARVGGKVQSKRVHIPGHRDRVIARATNDALLLLLQMLLDN